MQLDSHIDAIQQDLAATASIGDEATAEAARRLSDALGSTLHLRLLDLLGEAALEQTELRIGVLRDNTAARALYLDSGFWPYIETLSKTPTA